MPHPAFAAFPAGMRTAVDEVIPLLRKSESGLIHRSIEITDDGELLKVPGRIYDAEPRENAVETLGYDAFLVSCCWFTRHHDGHVRERYLRMIRAFDREWLICYGVLLIGEYVVEILDYLQANLHRFDEVLLGKWLRANPRIHIRVQSQIRSYWNEYYRRDVPRFEEYAGAKIAQFLSRAAAQK